MKRLLLTFGMISLFIFAGQAQDNKIIIEKKEKGKNTFVKIKEGVKHHVFIDGIKYDSEILDLIDPEKIESVSIYKGCWLQRHPTT